MQPIPGHILIKKRFRDTLWIIGLVCVTGLTLFYFLRDPGNKTVTNGTSFYSQINHLTTDRQGYKLSKTIRLHNVHNLTIQGLSIAGGNESAITLDNCSNIRITGNKLYHCAAPGIHLYQCSNIVVDHNFITDVSTAVYVQQTNHGGIVIKNNEFLNMRGPLPRGQFVQFDHVNGPDCIICDNRCENEPGKSNAEDAISLYMSNGTADSPITVKGNMIRGGGPSKTGGGIAMGDAGGSYQLVENNILVDPGQYGIGIAGGTNMQVLNNKIYARKSDFTNVGISVWNQYERASSCAVIVVAGNQVNWTNAKDAANHAWNSGNCGPVEGWGSNFWGAKITSSILPDRLISLKNKDHR